VDGYLLENDGLGHFSNVSEKRAPELAEMGMSTDMAWADVDNDGDQDMVIVGDWMSIKLFINDHGNFREKSEEFGLMNTEGWWNMIVSKDLNGDGYMDFVLGNHGLNSRFKASVNQPVSMYVNDFDLNGSVEQIICAFNGDTSYPVVMKDDLVRQIPSLERKYEYFEDFKEQTISDMFSEEVLKRSVVLHARVLESCVLINSGAGSFQLDPLPVEAQFSPIYAAVTEDFNMDGACDMVVGGNQYRAKPQTGIYNASYSLYISGNPDGSWSTVPADSSGLNIRGEIRDMKIFNAKGKKIMAVAKNNDILRFYTY
jgi:hypothetical protein